ncbi:hypothetical protein ACF0H5_023080 [Mactra antiquata]
MLLVLLSACLTILHLHHVTGTDVHFYVSPSGSDDNNNEGLNITQPCKTLKHAIYMAKDNKYSNDLKIIELLGGYYDVSGTVYINDIHNMIIRAYNKQEVHVVGGKRIPSSAFKPITDQNILSKLSASARQHVRMVHLPDVGITKYSNMTTYGGGSSRTAGMEISFNGQAMRLAQWPNKGYIGITATPDGLNGNTFKYNSTVPKSWLHETDPWIQGFLRFLWRDEAFPIGNINTNTMTITLDHKTYRGVVTGSWNNPKHTGSGGFFKIFNILSGLDEAGEYYIDKEHGNLYIWVPNTDGNVKSTDVVYGSMSHNCIQFNSGAKNVTLQDFTLESCRKYGITGGSLHDINLLNLEVKNTGSAAIHITSDSRNIHISQCLIHDCDGGIELTGGNRRTLESSGSIMEDNEIYRFTRAGIVGLEGIYVTGVGQILRNNHIYGGRGKAIFIAGNDMIIENNLIHDVCEGRYSCSAMLTSQDLTTRGNVFRSNIIHDIRGLEIRHTDCSGLILDYHSSGYLIYNNVFYNNDVDLRLQGGRDNRVTDNIFYNATVYNIAAIRRISHGNEAANMEHRLKNMPYHSSVWALRYPELSVIDSKNYSLPEDNEIAGNIVYLTGDEKFISYQPSDIESLEGYYQITNTGYSSGPSDHFNVKNGDFRVKCSAAEWANANKFSEVPSPNEVGPRNSPVGPSYLHHGRIHTVDTSSSSSACPTKTPVRTTPVGSYLPDGSDGHKIFNVSNEGCWLVVTKCTKHSGYVGTYRDMFGERFKHAGESEEMCFRRAVREWHDCGKHTSEPVAAIYGPTGATTFAGDGCFIAEYGCPNHGGPADGHAITTGKIYRDETAEKQYNASTNETNCLSQALTRWKYCGSSPNHPVTMIYRPTGAIRTAGAGCWIHTDVCPSHPEYVSMFYDAWGSTNRNTDSIQSACLNQAEYYWHLCGSDKDSPVTAYYRPTTASKTFP